MRKWKVLCHRIISICLIKFPHFLHLVSLNFHLFKEIFVKNFLLGKKIQE